MSDQPQKDIQTVTPEGKVVTPLPEGVKIRDLTTQVDDRGSLCETFDPRWDFDPEPMVYSYFVTIRPGAVKGWVHHKTYADRLAIVSGEMEVVLYDDRPESSTRGMLSKIVLTQFRRQLLRIPSHVWHLAHNIGQTEVIFINYPTRPYSHEDPDKYRLPLDNDLIPYKLDDPKGA